MHNHKTLFAFLLAGLMFSGCFRIHKVQSIPYESSSRSPKSVEYPMEILDNSEIDSEYKIIGEVTVFGSAFSDTEKMRSDLFNEALNMGGDAIIDFETSLTTETDYSKQLKKKTTSNTIIWKAKVIVWLD